MIKIISFKICPFVQRVTAALAAKKIPFEIEYISLKDKPQWFLELAPNGQVPVMVTESGTALFESDAIIEYIEDEYGPLAESISNEQRAVERAWSYLATKNYLVQCSTMSSKDEVTFSERSAKISTLLSKVEPQLQSEQKFFNSNQLGKVDIAWLPLLHRAAIVKEKTGYDFLCGFPKAQAWQQNILASGLINETVSTDFEKLFSDFYLSNTYLGEGKDVQKNEGCGTSACCG